MPQKKASGSRARAKVNHKAPARATTSRRSKGSSTGSAIAAEPTHEMIAKRAYEIWLKNIRRAYQPAQDWAEAQSQLRAELKKKPARARRPALTRTSDNRKEATPAVPAGSPAPVAAKTDNRLAA